MRKRFPSVIACHKKAREALRGKNGVRLMSVALLLLCFFAVCGLTVAGLAVMHVFFPKGGPAVYLLFACAMLLLIGILWAPVWEGLLSLFCRLVRHGHVGAAELLSFCVDKKRYRYSFLRYLGRLLRSALFLATAIIVARLGHVVAAYLVEADAIARAALVLGGTVCFLVLLLLLAVRFSYRTYLMEAARFAVPALSFRSVGVISAGGMRHKYGRVLLLDISFLPMFIFSFLLLGFPLFYVFPHYVAARAEMAFAILSVERA